MTPTPEQIAQWAREAGEFAMRNGTSVETCAATFNAHLVALACAWQAEQDHQFRQSVDGDAAIRASVKA